MADLDFYFDPICPFAWMTSKWVRDVAVQRVYDVEWRFISLRMVNADVDYAVHFPDGYEQAHSAGLALLRVAAAVREQAGPGGVADLYASMGARIFEVGPERQAAALAAPRATAADALAGAGLDAGLADAVGATGFDQLIGSETERALGLTGRDVGTPILHFDPPAGAALFGPVISRLPSPEDALALWDHVVGLARFPGFAELKRSLREVPQLPALGVAADSVGIEEDWQQGHRRQSAG
ncbi:MAG: mycothiol-dependent nitroreductase Rv2466c family protein [Acidimicrobiales bacterium]